ncbi:neural cell adhesion molecule 1-like [Babylonia areolata]|uniref:neural cell adhesion molecule 1-like n=1 Tax=Babylonia areolata TaxID=304850 RepID=UPI003FD3BF3B
MRDLWLHNTMKKTPIFFLVPALLALMVRGEIVIFPQGATKVHDMTTDDSSSIILFSCSATNSTSFEADLKWFDIKGEEVTATQGRMFIQRTPDSLDLLIANPEEEVAGFYTCTGLVNDVEEEARKQLKIYKGFNVLSDKEQYIVNGTDDKVMCRISSPGDDEPTISWYKVTTDDKGDINWLPIKADPKFHIHKPEKLTAKDPAYLEIRNVSLADQDTYLCNINNRILGKSHAHFISVVVTVPPVFTEPLSAVPLEPQEGRRLELSCTAEGIPPPRYNFTKYSDASRKDGEVVLENSTRGYLLIESVNRTDEGLYECVAMNQGGSENVSVEVNVRVPPVIQRAENLTVKEEEDVRLACVAVGDPMPQVSWSQHNIPISADPTQKVYVESGEDSQELNPVTLAFERTQYLVIPQVDPSHAGQYLCEAHNSYGDTQHTFFIDVTYMPSFGDDVDSHFYGWVGSDTNLTCMANGNPTPVITWYKGGVELKKDDIYDIEMGESENPHQAISYLIPRVDETNQDMVFGSYRCEATNDHGKNEVALAYNLAVVPEEPEAMLLKSYPTAFKLKLERPLKEGGQPVTRFILSYARADGEDEDGPQTVDVPLEEGEDSVETELPGLTPNTEYVINVTAVNNVGNGLPANLTATTLDYSKPEKVQVTSGRQGLKDTSYTLKWTIPMTGGAEITKYVVEYAVAEKVNASAEPWLATEVSSNIITRNVDGEQTTAYTLKNLSKNTYYQVRIRAVNRIGSSVVSTFVFKTSLGVTSGPLGTASSVQASAAVLCVVTMATASFRFLF